MTGFCAEGETSGDTATPSGPQFSLSGGAGASGITEAFSGAGLWH